MTVPEHKPRVLILYYTLSGQTISLLHHLSNGLAAVKVDVAMERLRPKKTIHFPIGSIPATIKMMFTTFFRWPTPIRKLSAKAFADYDLIILAGPTWSYNPSGPVLSLLKRDGKKLFPGRTVLPFISCRGYWRAHWLGLRYTLRKFGAQVPNKIIFTHPNPEPWLTIGVFLKIAGKSPERSQFLGKRYQRYGHNREQQEEARRFGILLGEGLQQHIPLENLDFLTPATRS